MRLDVLYGIRVLRRSPKFAFAAILILALGIGSATSIFSLVYQTVLRPLPFEDARLVYMMQRMSTDDLSPYEVSYLDFLDWRAESTQFDEMTAVSTNPWAMFLGGIDGERERRRSRSRRSADHADHVPTYPAGDVNPTGVQS